jgi:hypothetical protein
MLVLLLGTVRLRDRDAMVGDFRDGYFTDIHRVGFGVDGIASNWRWRKRLRSVNACGYSAGAYRHCC